MSNKILFGLSLIERLIKSGALNRFSDAVNSKNANTMSKILNDVDYSASANKATVDTFMNNPKAFKKS